MQVPVTRTLITLALAAVMASAQTVGAKALVLDRVTIEQDSLSLERLHVSLFFTSPPPANFPVYALTGPQRIVADLANTRARKGIVIPHSPVPAIESIDYTEANFGAEPNTRLEIFLKENVRYTAQIQGSVLSITLNLGGEVQKTLPIIAPGSPGGTSLRSLDVSVMDKSVEVDLGFNALPQTASVYLMQSPPRIMMDFYGVTIKQQMVKDIKVAPIQRISLVKRAEDSLYTGILVYLDRTLTFRYQQIGTRMIVNIPRGGLDPIAMRNMMFVGGGIILAGGVATGILLGSGAEKGQQSAASDLGAPPPLPGK